MGAVKGKAIVDFTEGRITGKMIKFALPLMATALLQSLYNAADMIVVANFAPNGSFAMGAVGACGSLFSLFINFFLGLSVGLIIHAIDPSERKAMYDADITYCTNNEIGFDYLTMEPVYNILTCTEDSITVESYEVGAEAAFNSFTITKTSAQGGRPEYKESYFTSIFNELVRKIGTIYALFNNIGRYSDLTEDGFDVNFFDCLLGR